MLETEGDRYRLFTRRAALLGGVQGLLLSGLVGRMYYLSIVQGQQYKVLADENRLSLRFIAPLRGRILDRFGKELATNRQDLRVAIIPEHVGDVEAALRALANVIELSESQIHLAKRIASRQRSFLPVLVKDNMSWDEFSRVNVKSPSLPGVQPLAGTSRFYPDKTAFAHVVGHVGSVSDKDKGDDPALQLPGFKVGKLGIERTFDAELRGAVGTRRVEVNARGRIVRDVARQESQPGHDVKLTLDAELQRIAAARLGEESASTIVMDLTQGDIMALVSTPAFDPNEFSTGISHENWKALTGDPRLPLTNKAIGGQYPPGSTFKMIVALAALKAGVVTPQETIFCNGKHPYGGNVFHCWKPGGHGHVDLEGSIRHSCDIYYYNMAERLGVQAIADMARQFGLGSRFDLPIPGQKAGLVPDPEWKRRVYGRSWLGGETLNMSIGQGSLLATPLQLAVLAGRLATGKALVPRILDDATVIPALPLPIPKSHLDLVREGMVNVVNKVDGTAFKARIRKEGQSMAGKSGTSQVRRISKAERETGVLDNDELAWRERDHAIFIAYGPVIKPRYAVSVLVEHGGGGSSVAAPIVRDILSAALDLDPMAKSKADVAVAADDVRKG